MNALEQKQKQKKENLTFSETSINIFKETMFKTSES